MKQQVNVAQSDLFRSFEPGQKVKLLAQAGHDYHGIISKDGKWIEWKGAGRSLLEDYFNDIKMDEEG